MSDVNHPHAGSHIAVEERKKYVRELFGTYRSYVEHEDGLVNQRSIWIYTIHGFLFAGYVLALQRTEMLLGHKIVYSILAAAGAFTGIGGIISIRAANRSIDLLVGSWNECLERYGGSVYDLPAGLTGGGAEKNVARGRLETYFFPGVLIAAWIALSILPWSGLLESHWDKRELPHVSMPSLSTAT